MLIKNSNKLISIHWNSNGSHALGMRMRFEAKVWKICFERVSIGESVGVGLILANNKIGP